MLDFQLYAWTKLNELELPSQQRRQRLLAELESSRAARPSLLRRLLAPPLVTFGSWLERLGTSLVAQPQTGD